MNWSWLRPESSVIIKVSISFNSGLNQLQFRPQSTSISKYIEKKHKGGILTWANHLKKISTKNPLYWRDFYTDFLFLVRWGAGPVHPSIATSNQGMRVTKQVLIYIHCQHPWSKWQVRLGLYCRFGGSGGTSSPGHNDCQRASVLRWECAQQSSQFQDWGTRKVPQHAIYTVELITRLLYYKCHRTWENITWQCSISEITIRAEGMMVQ